MAGDSSDKPFWDRERLTGRSLTMREYLDRVLWWVDSSAPPKLWADEPPPRIHEERREALREAIVDFEQRRLLERVGAGEDWWEIKASTEGGRWE